MGLIIGQMVANTLANGKVANKAARAGSHLHLVLKDKVIGRMEQELAGQTTNDRLPKF